MRLALARLRLSLALLLEGKGPWILLADLLVLAMATFSALLVGERIDIYPVFLVPTLLLGTPVLSELVAVERRAGTLDLALASPGASTYLERRVVAVWGVAMAQAAFVFVVARLFVLRFGVSFALVHAGLVTALLGSAALFWAIRLRSAGAVSLATLATVLALSPWALASPVYELSPDQPLPTLPQLLAFGKSVLVLTVATTLLWLTSRRRLARPETLL